MKKARVEHGGVLGGVNQIGPLNITFGDLSPPKSLKKGFLNRLLDKMQSTKKTEGWIEAGDPIISAAFDASTRELDRTSPKPFLALVINVETSDQHEY